MASKTRKKRDGASMKSIRELEAEVERAKMKTAEILELMDLKGWKQADLAEALGITHVTIWRWIEEQNSPSMAACMWMKQWLAQARREAAKNGKPRQVAAKSA